MFLGLPKTSVPLIYFKELTTLVNQLPKILTELGSFPNIFLCLVNEAEYGLYGLETFPGLPEERSVLLLSSDTDSSKTLPRVGGVLKLL